MAGQLSTYHFITSRDESHFFQDHCSDLYSLILKLNQHISRLYFPAKLREVLLYHVVPGMAPSSAVSNDLGLKTAGGKTIRMNIYLRYFLTVIK